MYVQLVTNTLFTLEIQYLDYVLNMLACSYQAGFAILGLHDTLLGVTLICCILGKLFASPTHLLCKNKKMHCTRERGRRKQYNTETNTNTNTHHSTVTYVGLAENWRVGVGAGAVQAFIAIAT